MRQRLTALPFRGSSGSPTAETAAPQEAMPVLNATRGRSILRFIAGGMVSLLMWGVALCVIATGCNQPKQETHALKPMKEKSEEPRPISLPPRSEETNIVRVNKIFEQFPWLSFDEDGSGRVDGFKCAVYLEGPESPKGVFGTGTLVVALYRLDRDRVGREVATEVYSWELPRDEAFGYRARNPTMLGWGYGLRLRWGAKVKVHGHKIAVVIKYIREDGRVISSSRKVLRVPFTGDSRGAYSEDSEPEPRRPAGKSNLRSNGQNIASPRSGRDNATPPGTTGRE